MSEAAPTRGRPGSPIGAGYRRRRRDRRTAIDVLFQADVTGEEPLAVARAWRAAGRNVSVDAERIVRGTWEAMREIDRILGEHSEDWSVHRMAPLDRTILRVASYELSVGVPAAVAISEAVEAANEVSSEDSGRFINGLLGRIAREGAAPGRPKGSGRP